MKRFPECDFIYESDQSFCDMDGRELVQDPRLEPLQQNVAEEPTTPAVKSKWRSFIFPVAATVVLVAVLFLAYYGFTHRTTPQHTNQSAAKRIEGTQSGSTLVPVWPAATATPFSTQSSD